MSSIGTRFPFFAAVMAVALFIFTGTGSADIYHVIPLGPAGAENLYGIDRSGHLIVANPIGNCSGAFSSCYLEFGPTGALLGVTATPPNLDYDSGGTCSGPLPSGFSILGASKCNNGHEVFGGEYYNPTLALTVCVGPTSGAQAIFCINHGNLIGIFTGFDPFADFIDGSGDQIDLNAAGDFGVISARNDEIYLGIVQTPEPSTMLLVGAGCISLFSVLRRRVVHT